MDNNGDRKQIPKITTNASMILVSMLQGMVLREAVTNC